jgi:hypothetical protein
LLKPQMRFFICVSRILLTFALSKEDDSNYRMAFNLRNALKEHEEMKKGFGFGGNTFLQNGQLKREPLGNDNQVWHLIRILHLHKHIQRTTN